MCGQKHSVQADIPHRSCAQMNACVPLWEYLGWNMFSVGRHQWHFLQHFQGNLVTVSSDTIETLRRLSGCAGEHLMNGWFVPYSWSLHIHNTLYKRSHRFLKVFVTTLVQWTWLMLQLAAVHTEAQKLAAAGFMLVTVCLCCTFIDNDDCDILHNRSDPFMSRLHLPSLWV